MTAETAYKYIKRHLLANAPHMQDAYTETKGQPRLTLFLSLTGTPGLLVTLGQLASNLQVSIYLYLPSTGISSAHYHTPSLFYLHEFWGPDSSLHSCVTSTLPMETSPPPQVAHILKSQERSQDCNIISAHPPPNICIPCLNEWPSPEWVLGLPWLLPLESASIHGAAWEYQQQ